jgi:FAD binding domain-containing protein
MVQNPAHDDESQPSAGPWDFAPELPSRRRFRVRDGGAVHQVLSSAGRAIPSGTCPTVGVAGLALGGGMGADSRHAGLTCDALQAATVVLPSGDVVTASANDNPDLF